MEFSDAVRRAVDDPRAPVGLVHKPDQGIVAVPPDGEDWTLPPLYPEWLGDRAFTATHAVRFPYVVGEMARGLATPLMVIKSARAGLLGFYGSAGLPLDEIRRGVSEIRAALDGSATAWGANLIHSPQEPGQEAAIVDLFLETRVKRVSASAFMRLSKDIVRYSARGLSRTPDGSVHRDTHVFAKVSRAEVARQFMAPPPEKLLRELVASDGITAEQADLAENLPIAADITAESDSGGHTDNRPAGALFSSLCAARAEVAAAQDWSQDEIRIGLAGGLGTPAAVAAAFQMGAAYVLTGSVNQAAVESGLSETGRLMLAGAGPADVAMAPAADMFEQGVKVQVLKRGTLFAVRGERLYKLYRAGFAYETLPARDKAFVDDLLGEPFDAAWRATADYLRKAAPRTLAAAEDDGNKRFALVCRRYLFQGAQWARAGEKDRRADFQIWCGPAMGAFNEWVAGTPLEPLEARTVKQIAWNLLEGAARIARAGQLRAAGVDVPAACFAYAPRIFE